MDDLTSSQKIIEQRKILFEWRNCYLRLKRILANEYVKFRIPEIAEQLKELKESYKEGLKVIQEKWI